MNNTELAKDGRIRVAYLEDLSVYTELEKLAERFRVPVSTVLRNATLAYVEREGGSGSLNLVQRREVPAPTTHIPRRKTVAKKPVKAKAKR